MLFRMKKPNYTEPMVGWNDEDRKTGITKYGVTHYEQAATMQKIPCPVRPPVVFIDLDEPEPVSLADDPEVENVDLQLVQTAPAAVAMSSLFTPVVVIYWSGAVVANTLLRAVRA